MFSYQELQVIDAVIRNGGFAAAAEELHKVPSAIGYTVKQVEEKIGANLFIRHHKSVEVTLAGEYFIEEARNIMRQLDELRLHTRRVANGWSNCLRVSVDNSVNEAYISSFVSQFYSEFEDVELVITSRKFNGMWDAIINDEVDIAIGSTMAVPVIKELKYEELNSIDWKFVVAKNHPLANEKAPLTKEQIIKYPSIITEDSTGLLFKQSGWQLDNQRRITLPSWSSAIDLLIKGTGIGSIPSHLAKPQVELGELIEKKVEFTPSISMCCIAWKREKEKHTLNWAVKYFRASVGSTAKD